MHSKFNPRFSRRKLLASVGATVAATPLLPLFESESKAAKGDIARVVMMFSPNGTIRNNWLPSGGQDDFTLSPILASLEQVRDQIVIMDGIRYPSGGAGNNHMAGPSKFTCGTGLLAGNDFAGGGDVSSGWGAGTSIDQTHASLVGGETAFASLEFGVRVTGSNVRHRLSYSGSNMPIPPENDPASMFDRLFSEFGADQAELARLRAERRSVLDVLGAQTEAIQSKVGVSDVAKMEAHLEGIREIEKRLDLAGATGEHCSVPEQTTPGDALATSAYPDVSALQLELLTMAFACDLTRSATFLWSGSTSGQTFPWLDIDEGHHDLSHAGDGNADAQQKLTNINTWYAEQFTSFVQMLGAIPEGNGTMLDNTIVLWGNELSKGNSHQVDPIPLVMAGGRNLGIDTGRFLSFDDGTIHNRVLVSILQALGHDVDSYGELDNGSGPLPGLFV